MLLVVRTMCGHADTLLGEQVKLSHMSLSAADSRPCMVHGGISESSVCPTGFSLTDLDVDIKPTGARSFLPRFTAFSKFFLLSCLQHGTKESRAQEGGK